MKFPKKTDYPNDLRILDNPEEDKDLYTKLVVSSASAYFQTDPITRYFFLKRFRIVDEYLNERRYFEALDVGCGIGFMLPMLYRRAGKTVGFDYSQDVLDYAEYMSKKKCLSMRFIKGDIEKLPFKDKEFELVVCLSVLEHFKNPEVPLAELKRVTRHTLIVGYPTETPIFHFLHNTVSRLSPKRRIINKALKEGDEHAEHASNAKTIQTAVDSLNMKEERKSIRPLGVELYRINFLTKNQT